MKRRDFLPVIAGATIWPLAARAQKQTMPVVGILGPSLTAEQQAALFGAFRQGLADAGYVVGKNVAIEERFTSPELAFEAARELVRRNVNVIFASVPDSVVAARNATTSIPIVALDLESDPLAKGYVSSLAHPGGNLTGMYLDLPELSGKQMGLLKEIIPRSLASQYSASQTSTWRNSRPPKRRHDSPSRVDWYIQHRAFLKNRSGRPIRAAGRC